MLKNLHRASDGMVSAPEQWARLADYALLYDQVIIPTGNLQVLPVLRIMLGEDIFDELIRTKGIVLARFDRWFGYGGGGMGLITFTSREGPDNPNTLNLGHSHFKPLDESIDIALRATKPRSDDARRKALSALLLDNVVELPTTQIFADVKPEAYADILGSPYLRDFLAVRNAGRSLDALHGINNDQVTIFNPHTEPEASDSREIRAVLRVAFENFLLSVGGHVDATEITGDDSTLSILKAKGQRLHLPVQGTSAFAQIQKITGVPDIGRAFALKQLSAAQLLELRSSKHAQAFRDWCAAGAPGEAADDTVRRYVESIGKPSWLDSLPLRIMRFGVVSAWSAVEPLTGTAASAMDTFLLSKWFPGRSPRLFLKHAKIVLANSPVVADAMKGRDRNSPCYCGSAKKFKKCHGA